MGGMTPPGTYRRPTRVPVVTGLLILVNVFVFVLELIRGEAFVTRWSAIPTQVVSNHHWITIPTAMFMHAPPQALINGVQPEWWEDLHNSRDTAAFVTGVVRQPEFVFSAPATALHFC